jgi:hypothetical protein
MQWVDKGQSSLRYPAGIKLSDLGGGSVYASASILAFSNQNTERGQMQGNLLPFMAYTEGSFSLSGYGMQYGTCAVGSIGCQCHRLGGDDDWGPAYAASANRNATGFIISINLTNNPRFILQSISKSSAVLVGL